MEGASSTAVEDPLSRHSPTAPPTGEQLDPRYPAGVGGGSMQLKTDEEGHYALSRTVRLKNPDCTGLTITVRAPGYASAYNKSDAPCSPGIVTINFKLFPLQS